MVSNSDLYGHDILSVLFINYGPWIQHMVDNGRDISSWYI
jgi:hypothetical protein